MTVQDNYRSMQTASVGVSVELLQAAYRYLTTA